MNFLIEYELFGYLALITNIISLLQKNNRRTLIILLISQIFFLLNMNILNLPSAPIYIASIGLSITIFSLYFLNNNKIKELGIKTSPLLMFIVVYFYGLNFIGIMSGIGFVFATIAKLQKDIYHLKFYLLLSTLSWLSAMIYIGYLSFIIFYVIGAITLIYSMYCLKKERM